MAALTALPTLPRLLARLRLPATLLLLARLLPAALLLLAGPRIILLVLLVLRVLVRILVRVLVGHSLLSSRVG
jgi:hypothetical protein